MKTLHILIGLTLVVALASVAGAQTAAPVLNLIGAQSVNEGQTLALHITSTDADATIPVLSTSALPTNAVFVDSLNGAGSLTFTPDFTQAGLFSITFFAADAVTADTASEIVSVTVVNVNQKPLLAAIAPQSVNEGQLLNVHVTATDPDGTTPNLSALNLPTNATFADSLTGGGLMNFSPTFTQAGVYNVSFVATDGLLADTQIVAVTVVNVNRKPTLAAIAPQSVNEGQVLNFRVSATDPDATIPTLSALNLPANATFTDSLNGAGSMIFSPTFTQAGVYNVSFVATDGLLADTQIVAVTVVNVNRKPTLAAIAPQSVNEGQLLSLRVSATDPDATIPTLSALNLPANATFTDSLNGAGSMSFSPTFTQAGVYNVSFVATDGLLADTQIVAVTVVNVNRKPTLAAIAPQSVNEGQVLSLKVSATDPDATIPTLSALNLPTNATFTDSLNGAGSMIFSPTFTQAGVYNVSFVATDGLLADTQIVAVTVVNVNRKPTLAAIAPQSVNEGQLLSLRVSATDPDATIPTLSALNLPANATFTDSLNGAGSMSFSPTFTQAGVYNVSFVATDGLLADTQIVAVTVVNVNRKPLLAAIAPQSVNEGQLLSLRVSATDPDATIPTLSALNLPANATFADSLNGAGSMIFSPTFTQAGVYNVSFVATDGLLADTQIVAVTVVNVNRKPTLAAIAPQSVNEGQLLSLRVSATDPDATTPTLSALNLPANATFTDSLNGAGSMSFSPTFTQAGVYNVSFVATDGLLADTQIVAVTVVNVNRKPTLAAIAPQSVNEGQLLIFRVSATDPDATIPTLSALNLPANATFTDSLNGAGSLSFSPTFTQAGIYNVRFVATDGSLADTQLVAVTVNNVNLAPVLANISNQSVPEGSTLNLRVSATDADGTTPLLFALNLPVNATFADSLNGVGGFVFSPSNTQSGVYNVSFVATDGSLSDTLIVQITVTNQNLLPVITVPGPQSVNEGQTLAFRISATDPDATIPTLTAFNLPANATFRDSLNGAGSLTFLPSYTQAGVYTISFIASDGFAADTGTVSITVNQVNLAPVVADPGPKSVNEGQLLTFRVSATDPDATIPTLSALNLPANATFTDSLNGAGSLSFSPTFTQAGVYNVSFVATDGLLADTQIVAVTVVNVNRKPTLAAIAPQSVNEGQLLIFRVSATDPDATIPTLSALNLPANATFTDSLNGAGSMIFSPIFTQAGVYNVSFVATDGLLADTQIVAVTVVNVNRKPTLAAIAPQSVNEGQVLNFRVSATDPDATIPTLSALNLPANATFADSLNGAGSLSFSPTFTQAGVYNVSFVATDGLLADTQIVAVTVVNVNRKPTLAAIAPQSVNESQLLSLRVSATDPDATIPTLSALNLPANATFTDSLNGAGSMIFSPTFTQAGVYNVSFVATDGLLADTQIVAVTVVNVNRKPTLAAIAPQSVNEGQLLSLRVSATDPDATIPTLSALNLPANATFTDSLNGAGSMIFSPTFTQAGVYNVSFVATDGLLADTQIVAITVVNVNLAPIFANIGNQSVPEGSTLNLRVSATDADGTTPLLFALNLPVNATFADSLNGVGGFVFSPSNTQSGVYNVSFVATDGSLSDTLIVQITVTNQNLLPVITVPGPQSVNEGQTLAFRISATDPDATIPTLTAFNLPANSTFRDSLNGAGSLTFSPSYTQAGVYTISFIASDGFAADTGTVAITVNQVNLAPVLANITAQSVPEGLTLNLHVTATDADGTTPSLSALNLPTNATFADSLTGGGLMSFSPSFTQAGIYNVSFVATDGALADTLVVQVTVTNQNLAPVITVPGPQSVNEGLALAFRISATDPDATIPTMSALNLPANATFTDSLNGAGSVSFSPNFTQAGIYTVSVIASDGFAADTGIVSITVNNVNLKPTLAAISPQSVLEGQTLGLRVSATDPDATIPVLSALNLPVNAIFTDSLNGAAAFIFSPNNTQSGVYNVSFIATDGLLSDTLVVQVTVSNQNLAPVITVPGPQSVNEGQALAFRVSATDPDATIPALSALNLPANATFTDSLNGAGSVSFSPSFTQAGVYIISVIASDGFAADTGTVSITVNNVNLAPVVVVPGAQLTAEGQTLRFRVTSSDPDGTISALSAFGLPINATFTDSLNGAGALAFSPDNTQSGVYDVSFIASDGILADTGVVQITVSNQNLAPVVTVPGPQSVNEGQTLAFRISATDPDATIPSLSALNLPANATFADSLNGAGSLTFSPNSTQAGLYTVSIIASDGVLADTGVIAITVNNVNAPPILATIGPRSVTEGQILTFRVNATDADGTMPVLSTSVLPTNAVFTDSLNGAGSFRFLPDFNQSGSYSVSFFATDGFLIDTEIVSITVFNFGTNTEPVITAVPDTSVTEGTPLVLTIQVSDPDGSTAPELSVNTTLRNYTFLDHHDFTGTLTYSPGYTNAGLDTVRVFATDFGSPRMTATEIFSVTTVDINQAPTWAPRGPYSLSAGQTLSFVVAAKDSTDPIATHRLFLSVVDAPLNSTFRDSANGRGLFYFAPVASQVGPDTVHFLAVDQGQPTMSSILSVIITVRQQNLAPVLTPIRDTVVTEGQLLSFRVSATDPEGTTPLLSASPLPSGAVFIDSANGAGSFRWTPKFVQAGLYSVTFKASDGATTGKKTIFIQVYEAGNQAPIFDSMPVISVLEADSVTQILTASDPDESPVTVSVVATTVPPFVTITVSGNKATVKAKPGYGDDGPYTFDLIASDGTLGDTATFTLNVLDAGNQQAVLASIGNKQITELLSLQFRVSASDADKSNPILSAAPLPIGATFIDSLNGAGLFSWIPTDADSGTYLVTFFAQDADSLAYIDSEQVTIVVKDSNRWPLIITTGSRTINEGQTLQYVVYGVDPDGTIPYLRARLEGTTDTLGTNMTMYDSANGTAVLTFRPDYTQGRISTDPITKGIYYVRFYAKDGTDTTLVKDATAPVQITVNNVIRPPVMNFSLGTGPFTIFEGAPLSFTVTASDPDGGSITNLTTSTLPTNATFAGTLPTRTFSFTPSFTQAGTYNVTFTATKTGGLTATQIVTINVTEAGNQNPVFTTVLADTISCPVGITLKLNVKAVEPDAQPITITASPTVPNSLFIDSTNGAATYYYIPDALDLGQVFRVTFIARDPLLAADTVSTVLQVTQFLRGDIDNNAKYTMNDLAYLIGYLFRQGPAPVSMDAADVDRDNGVNIGDITYLINFLYLNGPRPPQ